MERRSKHIQKNPKDFEFVDEVNLGRDTTEQHGNHSPGEAADRLNAALARAICDNHRKLGEYVRKTVFNKGLEAVMSKRGRSTYRNIPSRTGVTVPKTKLMTRRPLRGRRR